MASRSCVRDGLLLATILATFACGGEPRDGAAASADAASASSQSNALQPCRLVTPEQVTKVLPNHDGGSVAMAGGSLVKGVDAYQCSYVNPATDLLTVIVNVAADNERFATIKNSASFHSEHTPVPIADHAWVWGEDDDMKVQVEKGLAILDIELMAKNARDRTDAIVELARAAAANIR